MNLLKIAITFISIIFLSILNIRAQEALEKNFIDSTVIKVGSLMLDYYIIKEKGEAANKILLSNLKKKKYYSLNGGQLANTLLEDIHTVANDKHLMIKFYPKGDAAPYYDDQAKSENEDYIPNELSLKRSRIHNYGFKEVSILNMNIGYLKIDGFYDIRNLESTNAAAAAMDFLAKKVE
jgi:hypothetical protein